MNASLYVLMRSSDLIHISYCSSLIVRVKLFIMARNIANDSLSIRHALVIG